MERMPGRTNGRMDLELDRKMMMKKYTVVAAAMAAALALSGCNTVEGFGQDIKKGVGAVGHALGKAGDKISETAQSMSGEPAATDASKSSAGASGSQTPAPAAK